MSDNFALAPLPDAASVTALLKNNPNETFLTALRLDPKAVNKAKAREELLDSLPNNAGGKILNVHTELQKLADTLDDRVGALLEAHERDFFLAYKTHMISVQKEFDSLKLKADEHETKSRRQAKIQSLEKELRWFMKEALRLDELCKKYLTELEKWKRLADQLDDDRSFLEDQIKKSKAQNRSLRLSVERAQQHAYEALAASAAGAGNNTSTSQDLSGASGSQMLGNLGAEGNGMEAEMAALENLEQGGAGVGEEKEGEEEYDEQGMPLHSNMPEKMVERYRKTIKNLTQLVQAEKRKVQKLEITLANTPAPKVLEEYFVHCIDEAKEEVANRRTVYEKERNWLCLSCATSSAGLTRVWRYSHDKFTDFFLSILDLQKRCDPPPSTISSFPTSLPTTSGRSLICCSEIPSSSHCWRRKWRR
ncbi:unnamed protein product [Amoebophrya sp. A120]|nr:unnamed protein product [Amoebophrya sp. A120]|eukprot:GSA120T00024477001.1